VNRKLAVGVVLVSTAVSLSLYGLLLLAQMSAAAEARANDELRRYRLTHPDAVACRALGGFPVWSNWSFIDCRPMLAPR